MNRFFAFVFAAGAATVVLCYSAPSLAISMGVGLELHGDDLQKDAEKKITTLTGHASVTQTENILIADKIIVDASKGVVTASGNAKFENTKTSMAADDLRIRIKNGQWTIIKD